MEVNDLHSFLHFVQFPELDALRKVRDSNPRNSIRVIRFTFNIEKISIRFPRHFLGITIPSLQHSNYKSIVIDLIVFCQRPKFVCHIFGTVLSQKFGLFSPHQQPPDKGGYFFCFLRNFCGNPQSLGFPAIFAVFPIICDNAPIIWKRKQIHVNLHSLSV